jgi:parvulin-like peptidyl-prolyl isomerase
MALMTQIRNNLSTAFAVFAGLFIVYIVLDWGMDFTGRKSRGMMGSSEALGEVNGKEISYQYFSEMVKRAEDNQKKQTKTTDLDEETDRQIRSQVWEQVLDETLLDQEIHRLGITVTDQEIRNVLQGPNPPDFLVQQFRDSTGTFRRDAYTQAMRDPRNKDVWIQVEDLVRQTQQRTKLQSLLTAAVGISEGEVKEAYMNRQQSMNADYVLFDVNRMVPDASVKVTDDDLKKAYADHQENFHTKATRKIKYVTFTQTPAAQDSAAVYNEITKLLDQAQSGTMDFTELAKTYSEVPVNADAFVKHGELSRAKESAVFAGGKGQIIGPIKDEDGYHLIKILDARQSSTDEYIHSSHILIGAVQGPDSVKAIQKAKDIFKKVKAGADFAQLARTTSEDYGSAAQGGDIGWVKKGMLVKPFEEALYRGRVGEIVGPVRTQFGWHIIKITGKDKRELKLADLGLKIKASSETIDNTTQQAQDFAYLAKDEGFEKAAANSKYEVRESPEFTKTGSIPGLGQNDIITQFAFNNKAGKISEQLNIRGGLIVCMVSNVREEGVRPMEEVKAVVQNLALHQKKLEYIKNQVETFYKTLTPSSDIIAAAQSIPNITAQATGSFIPANPPAGIGNDQKFIGKLLAAQQGELLKPFEGQRGYFVAKLTAKTAFDAAQYNAVKAGLRDQLLNQKRNQFMAQWQTTLRDKANIVDNREKYYR